MNIIRQFKTRHFTVRVTAEPEYDLDLSWDEDGSIREGLDSGLYVAFCAKAAVIHDELGEIATDYLGNCIYRSIDEFQDHKGRKKAGYGSYFSDMVREVCTEAREYINSLSLPKMRQV